jgi:molecular chaperone GrpE
LLSENLFQALTINRKSLIKKDKSMAEPTPDSSADSSADSAGLPGSAGSHTTDAAADPPAAGESVQAQLLEAQAKAAEYMDMALRSRADVENLRKRAQADVAAAHKFAIEGFAESLLPVRDSLEMALKVDSPSIDSLREGVEATLRLMSVAFERHKLLAIDPVGEKFDPNRHQAISMVPAPDVPANHVVAVLQKGFLINDRVLRPAMVAVSSGT